MKLCCSIACLSMLTTTVLFLEAQPAAIDLTVEGRFIHDIACAGGVESRKPLPERTIHLVEGDVTIASTTTDARGAFQFQRRVPSGVYPSCSIEWRNELWQYESSFPNGTRELPGQSSILRLGRLGCNHRLADYLLPRCGRPLGKRTFWLCSLARTD